jgi:hypothetical protein
MSVLSGVGLEAMVRGWVRRFLGGAVGKRGGLGSSQNPLSQVPESQSGMVGEVWRLGVQEPRRLAGAKTGNAKRWA